MKTLEKNKHQFELSENKINITFDDLLSSFKVGTIASLAVFFFGVFSKILSFSLNSAESFSLSSSDLIISLWAYLIFSFIIFAAKIKKPSETY